MIRRGPLTALVKKELCSWFYSPLFYGTGAFFLVFLSLWLYNFQAFLVMDNASFRPLFSAYPFAFILVVPVLTMKSWAEEKKTGTAELLFTMPYSEWELTLGKFLSSFFLLIIYCLATLIIPLSLVPLGRFDIGVLFTEYTGVLLLGACSVSLGIFLSNLAKNQAAAFLSTAIILLGLVFIETIINRYAPVTGNAVSLRLLLNRLLYFLSLSYHFESFAKGLLDSRDIAFFILAAVLFLFLNTRLLIFRKWS